MISNLIIFLLSALIFLSIAHAIRNKHDKKRTTIKSTNPQRAINMNECEEIAWYMEHFFIKLTCMQIERIEWGRARERKKKWTDTNRVCLWERAHKIKAKINALTRNISTKNCDSATNKNEQNEQSFLFHTWIIILDRLLTCSHARYGRAQRTHIVWKDLCAYFIVYSSYPI